jgi:hypothetical protein
MKHCQNCGREVHDAYCSHCGQKAKEERIDFAYLRHEILHFFTHIEQGFLFTSWHMLVSPGRVVTDFVKGKRKNYQSPVSYFLIWITIYLLLLYFTEKIFGINVAINYKEYFGPTTATEFAIRNLSFVLMVVLPFQALYFYWLVARGKYNYFESFVSAMFFLGTVILLQSLFVIIAVLVHLVSKASIALVLSDPLKILFLGWAVADTIKLFHVQNKTIRAILFLILAFGTFTVWRLYGVPAIAEWLLKKH